MKTLKKTIALFLVILTIFTACSVVMPVLASSELVTAGNVTSGNAPETEAEPTEEPEILSEIIEKREENAKHFLMSDGTFMVAQYPTAVHYQNDSEEWIEYDNTVKETEATTEQAELFGTDELYSTSNLLENIVFAEKSNSNTLVSYEAKDYPISFNYQSAKKSRIKIIKNETELTGNDAFLALPDITQEVVYENVFYGVDLQYIVSPDKLKENIIIKNKSAQNSFTVNYNIGELTAEVVDAKTISLMSGEEVIYTISAPYMYDANGEKSENITLTAEKNKNGKLTVNITVDSQWLQAENRVYPVVVDPTIETEIDRNTIDSVMITKACGNTNWSAQSEMVVGFESSDYGQCRVLVKFTLPALNKGDVLIDAELRILNTNLEYYYDNTADMQVNAHMLTGEWSLTGVTWNNQPTYSSVVSDYSIFKKGTTPAWHYFNITQMAKEWYNDSTSNNGILLKSSTEVADKYINGVKAKLYSEKYNSIEENYPALYLTYRNNKGIEDFWSYTTLSAGTAGTAYINDYTGNLVFIHGDVATTGELMPVSLEHVYNGYMADKNASTYPHSGRGNKLSLQQTVKASGIADYPYIYEDGDGTQHYFYKETKDGVTKYKDEDGLNLELKVESGGGYTITDKSGNIMTFNSSGLLTEISDADGNKAILTYSTEKNTAGENKPFLKTITDGAGHKITLTYKTGENYSSCQLTKITGPDGKSITYNTSGGKRSMVTYPDGTHSEYSYYDDGTLKSAKSYDGYTLTFTYGEDGAKRVTSVTESGGNTVGQKIVFSRDKVNQTVIETAGKDAVFGGDDDLITVYQFDNFGRTVSTKMKQRDGTSLGAEKYDYTAGSQGGGTDIGKRNRISASAAMGKNVNNVLANHNFESNGGWTPLYWMSNAYTSNSTAAIGEGDSYIGAKSIAITVNENGATTNGGFSMYQDVTEYVSEGTYTLSGYVKTSGVAMGTGTTKGGACLGLRITDAEGKHSRVYSEMLTGTTDTSIDNGWQRIYVTFTVAEGESVRVVPMLFNATGTAYFDCLQLEKSSVPNSYNLLQNASFEKDTNAWSEWNTDGNDGITEDKKNSGKKSYKIKGSATADKYIRQTVVVSGSEKDTYILSGYVRANSVHLDMEAGKRMDLAVKITYEDGTTKVKRPALFNGDVLGSWQYASGVFTLSDDDSSTKKTPQSIAVYCGYRKQANTCYFDDISLIKEPAPTYSYDKDGNLVSATENAEKTSALDYDGNNNLTSFTDERGGVYKYTYNDSGNTHRLLKAESKETGITYAYTYNASGIAYRQDVKSKAGTSVIRTGNTYTAAGDGIAAHAYVATSKDQHGYTTTYNYDLQSGRLMNVTDPKGTVTTYEYDENNGNILSVQTGNKTVSYGYDNSKTRLTSITHNGFNYNFVYDAFGNVKQTKVGSQALMTNDYQANNGMLLKSTYGNGDYKEYTYNDYGQTTKVKLNGSTAYSWSYNSTGQAYKHTDSVTNRIYNYVYDSLGRIIREYGKNTDGTNRFASEYTYDLSNNLKKVENSTDTRTVTTKYTYDKENRPTKTTINSSVNYSYVYDTLGRLDNIVMGNTSADDIIVNYDYYVSARDTNLEDSVTYRTTQIKREEIGGRTYEYTYGKRGNITKITEKVGSGTATEKVSYTYDALGQLKTENNVDLGERIVYTYDNGGNLLTKKIYAYTDGTVGSLLDTINYTYGDTNWKDKLTAYDGQSISYDAIGNPTSYLGATLTWNGRQLESFENSEYDIDFKYDADGLRTQKIVNGVLHEYEYSGGRLFYEKRGDIQFYYRYDALGNLATITRIKADGEIFNGYVICNSRGDVEEIRYASGEPYARYVYDSWGNTIAVYDANGQIVNSETHLAVQNPIRYRGYYWDSETELYYLQSRYYDPVVGRFISADSYVSTGQGVLGSNMFAYCQNNPIKYSDKSGKFIGAAIGALIGGIVGAISSARNNDNVVKGAIIGAATGAVSGLAVDAAVATGGLVGIAIAFAGGAVASGMNYAATEHANGRKVDSRKLATEAVVGGVFNVLSFGTSGGSLKTVGGNVIKKMVDNAKTDIFKNTTRIVCGKKAMKSTYGIVKNVLKNIGESYSMSSVETLGSAVTVKVIEYAYE